jgi:hypothetical protein
MSRVITFSKTFPSYHKKAGQPTHFIEKVWASLVDQEIEAPELWHGWFNLNINYPFNSESFMSSPGKHHTIRPGTRWKAGDKFSPRIWKDKPYRSPQIQFAPDIEIKKVWDFYIDNDGNFSIDGNILLHADTLKLANNDGLLLEDLYEWFPVDKPINGQVICWNDNIIY